MPSTELRALLVALLVVLAGCGALPGGDGDSAQQSGPAEQHVVYFSSSDHAYNATITVTGPDGETVLERTHSFEAGEGRYLDLTTLNDSGNYTLHVQTDIPAVGGGTMDAETTVPVDPGSETTVVHTDFQDIEFVTGTTPTEADVQVPVQAGWVFPRSGELSYTIYRGDSAVRNETATISGDADNLVQVDTIETPGVYWVAATTNLTHETAYGIGFVNESTHSVIIGTEHTGDAVITFRSEGQGGGFARAPPGRTLRT